ncbi:MAG: hypothetical protein JWN48_1966 [Myxococcaceae bacterium]|nr:hypothetical protein [Myxococcaceae bacterium]
MLGLTQLGLVHTAISLVALASGAVALVRDRRITFHNAVGKVYVVTTALTCLTGFGIFQHGGFGKPHVLGIITLLVLGLAMAAERYDAFGRLAKYVATVGYSATFFFHWVPTLTETATRLPAGAPLVSSPDDPGLQNAIGVVLLLFLVGAALQVRRLRTAPSEAAVAPVLAPPAE